jgi:hypothetical protein
MRAAWNISVEHFFLRGTIPWNIFSAWNILGKLLAKPGSLLQMAGIYRARPGYRK